MTFLSTSDLRTFADKEGSDAALPRWIERLIKASAKKWKTIEFQKDKFTNLPGVDGQVTGCEVQPGFEQYLPAGDSL